MGINPDVSHTVPVLLIHTAVSQNQTIFFSCVFKMISLLYQQCTFQQHNVNSCEGCWQLLYLQFTVQMNEVIYLKGSMSSGHPFKAASVLHPFRPQRTVIEYKKNMTRSQEFDFFMCQIQCWTAKSFNTLIVKSFILFHIPQTP